MLAIVKKEHTTDPAKIRQILRPIRSSRHASPLTASRRPMGRRNIRSGPGFITKDNIDKVVKYAGQYR